MKAESADAFPLILQRNFTWLHLYNDLLSLNKDLPVIYKVLNGAAIYRIGILLSHYKPQQRCVWLTDQNVNTALF